MLDLLDAKSLSVACNPYLGMARENIAEDVRHFPVAKYLIRDRISMTASK